MRDYSVLDGLLEGCQIIDRDWRYVYLNRAALKHAHRTAAELLGRTMEQAYPGIERTEMFGALRACMQDRDPRRIENEFEYPDGSRGWFDLSIEAVPEGIFILSLDITERKRLERQNDHMRRLYATLSQVNQAIVRLKDRERLFQTMCRVGVEFGKFGMAWVSLLDEAGELQPVVSAGIELSELQSRPDLVAGAFKDAVTAESIRAARVASCDDGRARGAAAAAHEAHLRAGMGSAAAIPFLTGGRAMGAMTVLAVEADAFDDEREQALLREMSLDVSFALENMEREARRERAETEKHASQAKMEAAIASTADAVLISDAQGNFIDFNDAFAAFHRFKNKQECARTLAEYPGLFEVYLPSGELAPVEMWPISRALRGEKGVNAEYGVHRKDSDEDWVGSYSYAPMRDESGGIIGAVLSARDITEQKRTQAELVKQLQRLSALRAIDLAITGSMDMNVSLGILLSETAKALQVDAAAIFLVPGPSAGLEYRAGVGFRGRGFAGTHLRPGEGAAGAAVKERRTVSVPDLAAEHLPMARPDLIEQEGFVSVVATPLISKGEVKGVLEVFHRKPLHPNADWTGFLEALAGQAAIAIDSAQSFSDLERSVFELAIAYDSTIEGWSHAMDLRDKETEGHTERVTETAVELARRLGMAERDVVHMRRGALLHDMGKMGVPDAVLLKPGPLTDEEWVLMKRHPTFAYEMLKDIRYLAPAVDVPYCHHEKWDGSGYPRGLQGEAIPLAARIFSVVDVWDAVTSDRPYRPAWSREKAAAHLKAEAGKQFDPQIVPEFLRLIGEG